MSFRTALGEFSETLDQYDHMSWVIFFLCCIVNIILLLNLLIAIISETYETISSTALETGYKEKVAMMAFL